MRKQSLKIALVFFFAVHLPLCQGSELPTETLSFLQAVSAIVERDPSVQSVKATAEQIKATNKYNHALWLPTLEMDLSTNSNHDPTNYNSSNGSTYNYYTDLLTSNINLFHFGADLNAMKAATSQDDAAEKQVDKAILDSELNAITLISQDVSHILEKEAANRIVGEFKEAKEIFENRVEAGLASSSDLDKIEVDLAHIASLYSATATNLTNSRAALITALGHDRVQPEWPWKSKFQELFFPSEEVVLRSLKQRPDWRSAEQTVQAADYSTKENFERMLPSLDLFFSAGYGEIQGYPANTGLIYNAGLKLSIPIFDRWLQRSKYEAAVHVKEGAEANLEKVRRAAKQEWNTSKEDFKIALNNAVRSEKNVTLARTLVKHTLLNLQRGIGNANEVLVDQQRVYNAELDSIRAWRDAHQLFGSMCHGLGFHLSDCLEGAFAKKQTN